MVVDKFIKCNFANQIITGDTVDKRMLENLVWIFVVVIVNGLIVRERFL